MPRNEFYRSAVDQRRICKGPLGRGWRLVGVAGALLLAWSAGCDGPTTQPPADTPPAGKPATIATKAGLEMVLIPAGQFTMGNDQGEDDERPAHAVELGAFYIDVAEVPQDSFAKIMGRNPAKSQSPDKPVESVSWLAAIQYCNLRSTEEGLAPCYDLQTLRCDFAADGYRLPTEAEWEYACRAGSSTSWSFGDDGQQLGRYAWFKANAGKTTHRGKEKTANAWGLYDMHGNVAEWCNDFYDEKSYAGAAAKDPRGPTAGQERVLRGGSFTASADDCRSSARASAPPVFSDVCFGRETFGFRCVRKAGEAAK